MQTNINEIAKIRLHKNRQLIPDIKENDGNNNLHNFNRISININIVKISKQ